MKPLRVHEELGYFNVDHFEKACYYNDGNAGGIDFGNDTFEYRCYLNVGTFENRCNESDPSKRGL